MNDLFVMPTTREGFLEKLKELRKAGMIFHLDDDAHTVVTSVTDPVSKLVGSQVRVFSDFEADWLNAFVDQLNEMFLPEVAEEDRRVINAGSWFAAELSGYYEDVEREISEL